MTGQSAYGPDYVQTSAVVIDATSPFTGQITCTGVGTAVQGGSVGLSDGVVIKALAANAGKVYVGYNGTSVGTASGFELSAGEQIPVFAANLNQIWFDGAVTDKISWIKA